MATIRMARSAGAALIALMAIVPAAAQAQAPLQLVPGPNQAKKVTGVGTAKTASTKKAARSPGNRTRSAAAQTSPRQNAATTTAAAAQAPSTKSARTHTRKTANSVASRRQNGPTINAERARVATAPHLRRAAAVTPQPSPPDTAAAPQILAQGGNEHVASDNVLRGADSVSLVGMLPWWRNDRMQDVNYGSEEAESKVMAAADAWLAAHGGRAVDDDTRDAAAPAEETFDIADANEVNEIDLAAASVPAPPEPSFLQSLIALIGSAVAAAAASARLLFT